VTAGARMLYTVHQTHTRLRVSTIAGIVRTGLRIAHKRRIYAMGIQSVCLSVYQTNESIHNDQQATEVKQQTSVKCTLKTWRFICDCNFG